MKQSGSNNKLDDQPKVTQNTSPLSNVSPDINNQEISKQNSIIIQVVTLKSVPYAFFEAVKFIF